MEVGRPSIQRLTFIHAFLNLVVTTSTHVVDRPVGILAFRSLECRTLPMPTINGELLQDIFHEQEWLNAKFNRGVASVIDYLLQEVGLREVLIVIIMLVDGPVFTELVLGFFRCNQHSQYPIELSAQLASSNKGEVLGDCRGASRRISHCNGRFCAFKFSFRFIRIHKVAVKKIQMILESKLHILDPFFLSISKEGTVEFFEQRLVEHGTSGAVNGVALYEFVTEKFYASKFSVNLC